jgi:oxygen-independent coproporphyrinogen III oxidase
MRGSQAEPVAVYVHTPFCPSKCAYCDFNSYAMSGDIMERTTKATIEELRRSPWKGRPAKTIFIGGGTPTFLPSHLLAALVEEVIATHPPIEGAEITSEANPGAVDFPKFKTLKQAGVNRVSLGAQSFSTGDLVRLGRVHEAHQAAEAVWEARRAGFDNVNLDLMFALPGQSMKAWEWNLDAAIGLRPEHLSLYCLTIEPNTRYYRLNLRGMLNLPDDDAQVEMYDLALDKANHGGYEQYEISNFSRPGRESRHNLCYWRCEEYAAYGPGAVGCMEMDEGLTRWTNTKHPESYSTLVEEGRGLAFESEVITPEMAQVEKLMMGLRLNEGVAIEGLGLAQKTVSDLEARGWITVSEGRITLTRLGRRFCSEAVVELMP